MYEEVVRSNLLFFNKSNVICTMLTCITL